MLMNNEQILNIHKCDYLLIELHRHLFLPASYQTMLTWHGPLIPVNLRNSFLSMTLNKYWDNWGING